MKKVTDSTVSIEEIQNNLQNTDNNAAILPKKTFKKYRQPKIGLPNLVENQISSYEKMIKEEMWDIFKEFTPILDYSEKKFELDIISFEIGEPKYDEVYVKENKLTYEAPMKVKISLTNKELGTKKEQELFLTDFPMMTVHGTFIVNGIERVVVPQLARAFGVFFDAEDMKDGRYYSAKVVPSRGVWVEFLSESEDQISVRIDKKRKFALVPFLRAFGFKSDAEMIASFKDEQVKKIISNLIENTSIKTREESFVEIYKKLRDGEVASPENAKEFFDSMFSKERYDLSPVGRFRFNKRFGLDTEKKTLNNRSLSKEDIAIIVEYLIKSNIDPNSNPDDIDHLASRRVRFVGEMMLGQVRKGLLQMKRNIQDKMSVIDKDVSLPVAVVNPRPFQARIKEFFTINQLSQFMVQDNILSELEHLRTLSALGPGGLNRERAGFEVRDVHTSHYGRLCPIQTPEGSNIGLILRMSVYARINEFGIIETPYVKVKNGKVTTEIVYMNALEEEKYVISSAQINYDESGKILDEKVTARKYSHPAFVNVDEVEYMDVASNQAYSISTSMLPFLEHDDATRALMASNMQRQSVPLIRPEAPYVSTGVESIAGKNIGRLVLAEDNGLVTYVDSKKIKVLYDGEKKEKEYSLINFSKTNVHNYFHHRVIVNLNQKVKKGDVLADVPTTQNGQVALGQNVLVAFMPWNGANYEDAIIISEKLLGDSKFTSIHIEEYICMVRDTKLGEEQTTHDIPNVGETKLKNLDEDGIIRIGSEVRPGDILVGKITPKGETELSAEERLLRSIFGDKVRDVKDTSLRVENGSRGRVVGVKVFSREKGDQIESGVIKRIHIEVAQLRNLQVGDKLAGRHGNKGVISRVLPVEEMPYMADGTPVDIILTPLGVPSRMNLGQILEMHLGLAAKALGYQAVVPIFQGATIEEIGDELEKAGLDRDGKTVLFDGRTGESFENRVAIGEMYMLKLHHMVEDKIHQRSTGPYSLITQQPLGGRAQHGGQRFGEMEVWALEGYGASHILREMLTIKSDDIEGRAKAYDSIIKGETIKEPNTPAAFTVLLNTIRGLGLNPEPIGVREVKELIIGEDVIQDDQEELLKNKLSK